MQTFKFRLVGCGGCGGYGERVVSFTVNGYSKKMPYRDIELDVGAMEGLLSYEATEAKEK